MPAQLFEIPKWRDIKIPVNSGQWWADEWLISWALLRLIPPQYGKDEEENFKLAKEYLKNSIEAGITLSKYSQWRIQQVKDKMERQQQPTIKEVRAYQVTHPDGRKEIILY